ncbi:MAG: glycerol-3-phosphate acyltransferase [Anaerolineae bacterium]|nr:glycerol-3-phosphate acyltransferase [Anaerolineae bacterium]
MVPIIALTAALVGYLFGAISFARLVAGVVLPGEDISSTIMELPGKDIGLEMKSVSATSVMMHTGPKYGCLTSILDMAKVSIPTLVFMLMYPGEDYFLITAVAGVAGHNFPIYYKFKGGRGVSPIFGGLLIIDWLAIPVTVLISNILGLALFRNVMIAYTGFTVLLIPWMWFRFHEWAYVAYAVAVTLLFYLAMIPELKQYYALWRAGELEGIEMDEVMETTHMKYVLRMGKKMGFIKEKPEAERDAPVS